MDKIANILRGVEVIAKGGVGSGRYPKGSGKLAEHKNMESRIDREMVELKGVSTFPKARGRYFADQQTKIALQYNAGKHDKVVKEIEDKLKELEANTTVNPTAKQAAINRFKYHLSALKKY